MPPAAAARDPDSAAVAFARSNRVFLSGAVAGAEKTGTVFVVARKQPCLCWRSYLAVWLQDCWKAARSSRLVRCPASQLYQLSALSSRLSLLLAFSLPLCFSLSLCLAVCFAVCLASSLWLCRCSCLCICLCIWRCPLPAALCPLPSVLCLCLCRCRCMFLSLSVSVCLSLSHTDAPHAPRKQHTHHTHRLKTLRGAAHPACARCTELVPRAAKEMMQPCPLYLHAISWLPPCLCMRCTELVKTRTQRDDATLSTLPA